MINKLPKKGERVEKASRFVPECNSFLDVGCGDGIIAEFIKEKAKNIYGIDNDSRELDKARKRKLKVVRLDLDSEQIPFKVNFFDVITCLDVIEHVIDPNALLKEMYRVLKKNGTLILSTPNIRFSDHLSKLIFGGSFPKTSIDSSLYDGGHLHFFTYKDVRDILEKNGFRNIKEDEIINKDARGWKGKILINLIGDSMMREFRSPGILIIAKK